MSFQRMSEQKYVDIDFYERKISRLTEQIIIIEDQLTKVRLKLRMAQDYQIKFNIAIENAETDLLKAKIHFEREHEIKMKQILSKAIKQNNERWERQTREKQERQGGQSKKQLQETRKELQEAIKKVTQLSQKRQEMQLFSFKIRKFEKENQGLTKQLSQLKIYNEKQKQQQLNALKNHLNSTHRQKLNHERKLNETKVSNLETQLREMELQRDRQLFAMPDDRATFDLIELKKDYEQSKRYQEKLINQLREMLERKHTEYLHMSEDKQNEKVDNKEKLQEKRLIIMSLQKKVSEMISQHNQEHLSAVNNTIKDKNKEIQLLKKLIKKLQNKNTSLDQFWNERFQGYQKEEKQLQKKHTSEIQVLSAQIQQYRRMITQFQLFKTQQRPQNKEKPIDKQQKHKQNSSFVLLSNELRLYKLRYDQTLDKNIRLQKQIMDLNDQFKEHKKQIEGYYQDQIKRYVEKIHEVEITLKDYLNMSKTKELEVRKYKKDIYQINKKHQNQKQQYKDINNSLERNYKKILDKNTELQDKINELRNSEINSKAERGTLIKEKWIEIQQESIRLQNIFKVKQDSLNTRALSQKTQLNKNLQKYKNQAQFSSKENDFLKKQKDQLLKDLKIDKENGANDYDQKIASLNLQIAMTENIFSYLESHRSQDPIRQDLK